MDALSVPETYFWREVDQVRAVVCHVMPLLARRFPGGIRIWSAPCATGEEPLSIAMALNEAGWFDRAPIEIHGSDGSRGGDRQGARRAVPRRGRCGRSRRGMMERYFTERAASTRRGPS